MYESLKAQLRTNPKRWLVTGVAGFIGSNLLERLLELNQHVVGLDNFATGHRHNLNEAEQKLGPRVWKNFQFIEANIADVAACQRACRGVDFVLHQAALGSVPRSIEDPLRTNDSNVTGFLNMLVAARDQQVKRFVYASSSAVYGDHPALPKVEENIGACLSPYAVSKRVNELYAEVFGRCYSLATIGLRYFNVFGPRQDPEGAYAAVIPKWIASLLRNQTVFINGDGETSRDFCYIENVVQVNLLAATAANPEAMNQVFNVALNSRVSLNELFRLIRDRLAQRVSQVKTLQPKHRDFRPGDVRHSQADISKARRLLGYAPTHSIEQGLDAALDWYVRQVTTR